MLSTSLTPRIYALKYIRQRFNSYFEHFGKFKKAIYFKFPFTIIPFKPKRKIEREITEELFQEMKLQVGVKIHYEPYHIILEKRIQANFSTYENQENQLLSKITIKDTWEKVKEILISYWKIEQLGKFYSTLVFPTPSKNGVGLKRIELEASEMEIYSEHLSKKLSTKSSQVSNIMIIQEQVEEVEWQEIPPYVLVCTMQNFSTIEATWERVEGSQEDSSTHIFLNIIS
jgi:hypothetical protein